MVEVCAKVLFRLELSRSDKERDFGLSIEAELAEDTEQEDELRVFISDVTKGGPAARKGYQLIYCLRLNKVCLSFSLSLSLYIYIYIYMCVCVCVYLCMCVCMCVRACGLNKNYFKLLF